MHVRGQHPAVTSYRLHTERTDPSNVTTVAPKPAVDVAKDSEHQKLPRDLRLADIRIKVKNEAASKYVDRKEVLKVKRLFGLLRRFPRYDNLLHPERS